MLGVCNNYYGSVCVMRCNEGYEAIGSRERRCDVSFNDVVRWTGSAMQCKVIKMPHSFNTKLQTLLLEFAQLRASCIKVVVPLDARRGYRLIGSRDRACELDKSWSGGSTSCDQIQCPKLPPVQAGVSLVPPICACWTSDGGYDLRVAGVLLDILSQSIPRS
ncbi:hypothetical protein OS493_011516 [Desmophyllum pertusum]|uniref:Sushi domain-containing protein n=1 Tax=Desmophyllum pertusum TaxID=174260 RepID=A0A9X0CNE4_9CNID|nr:hypothetical protein OS493_011516 [Desmophyllum pertusum]